MRMTPKLRQEYIQWLGGGIQLARKQKMFTDEVWDWLERNAFWVMKKLCDAPPHVREQYTYSNVAEKISRMYFNEQRRLEKARAERMLAKHLK